MKIEFIRGNKTSFERENAALFEEVEHIWEDIDRTVDITEIVAGNFYFEQLARNFKISAWVVAGLAISVITLADIVRGGLSGFEDINTIFKLPFFFEWILLLELLLLGIWGMAKRRAYLTNNNIRALLHIENMTIFAKRGYVWKTNKQCDRLWLHFIEQEESKVFGLEKIIANAKDLVS